MTTNSQKPGQDKARIRIDVEATGEEGSEFRIRIYSGHSQTTNGDRVLFRTVYEVMTRLSKVPTRTKTVMGADGTEKQVPPKTKSGKPFPTVFPFVVRRK